MDSSHPQRITSSNRKCKAKNSMMIISKLTKFMEIYQRQNFSMPDSVIFYITKNPKTAELYLKMVKTCKHFFIKNEIIVVPHLFAGDGKLKVMGTSFDLKKYNCKYWITNKIHASGRDRVNRNTFSPIIPKLYRCDVKSLSLYSQVVSFNDLSLLISSAEQIYLYSVTVKKCDSVIPLEDIIAIAVKAKSVDVTKPTITPETMRELTKLSNLSKIVYFNLHNLTEAFDIDAFYSYVKKNQHTKLYISFNPQISDAFKNRLETIVDEILETKHFSYKPPVFNFAGLDIHKSAKLYRIYFSH